MDTSGAGNDHQEEQQLQQQAFHSPRQQPMSPPMPQDQNSSFGSSRPVTASSNPPSSSHSYSGFNSYAYERPREQQEQNAAQAATRNSVVIKVGMVGDAQIGKTSLMVKYVEGSFDEDYIQTLGTL